LDAFLGLAATNKTVFVSSLDSAGPVTFTVTLSICSQSQGIVFRRRKTPARAVTRPVPLLARGQIKNTGLGCRITAARAIPLPVSFCIRSQNRTGAENKYDTEYQTQLQNVLHKTLLCFGIAANISTLHCARIETPFSNSPKEASLYFDRIPGHG
jgi:hypothetical protein